MPTKDNITHILFDLHGTLIDGVRMVPCWAQVLGRFMESRYGASAALWTQANLAIDADWDSYFADLNLDGEEGLNDMHEGLFRTTRALFRIVGVSEPPIAEVHQLVDEIYGYVPSQCDVLFPDAKPVLHDLVERGYTLGIVSHALSQHSSGALFGAGVRDYFNGPIIGPMEAGRFRKDETFLDRALFAAGISSPAALLVDDSRETVESARKLGMFALYLDRRGQHQREGVIHYLSALLAYLPR